MNTIKFWNAGEKSRLAKAAQLELRQVVDIVAGRLNVSPKRAQVLEAASLLVLGRDRMIPFSAWLRVQSHPALGAPK